MKKEFPCPHCPEVCSRNWNRKVHINRKHPNLGGNTQQHNVGPAQDHHMERLFRQYQVNLEEKMKNRKEVEKDGVRQAFDNFLRAVMINQTQNHGNPHSAGLPPQLYYLIVAGNLVPIQTSDANGNIVIRYEPRNIADTIAPIQRQNGNDHRVYEILRLLEETYSKITEILMKAIEAMRSEEDMKRLRYLLDRIRTTNTEEERRRLDSGRHAVPGKKEEERGRKGRIRT